MPLILILGDLVALLLFVFFGQREHELTGAAGPILRLLATGSLFALPWLAAGGLLGAFPRRPASVRSLVGPALVAWLVAAPLAVLLRAFLLRRAVIPTAFFAVSLALGGAFLLGWRLLVAMGWWWTNRPRQGTP